MTVKRLLTSWDRFLFEPAPVTPIAVLRVLVGLLVLTWGIRLGPDLEDFYGADAAVSSEVAGQFAAGLLNLFAWLPGGDAWLWAVYSALVISAVCVTVGLWTRVSSIVLFVLLCSFAARNPAVLNAGDRILRIVLFFLILSPAGRAISLDRLRRVARGLEVAGTPVLHAPWAQRLIQVEFSVIYIMTYAWKVSSPVWRDGTALYYVTRLEVFYRLPVPVLFDYPESIRLIAWGVLAIECALGTLVWVPSIRYYVLATGVLMHLAIDYSMDIPLFQWTMIAMMAAFVGPDVYARAAERFRGVVRRGAGRLSGGLNRQAAGRA
jgi:uncharacterized membrane protein YphA (DoxX/SURF4 family)